MQYFYINNNSVDLIVFFAGWGCDENQFTNLQDHKDILILYNYQNLELDFDFSKYENIYVLAYSAGVFVASILANNIPNVRQKVALCGNPYLFDEILGLSAEIVQIFREITLDNYLEFRRKYMVFSDEEYVKYNQLQSIRSIESCQNELDALQRLYLQNKKHINPMFDKAIVAENDLIFNLSAQKNFYKDKLFIVPSARHHIFFKFKSFEEMLSVA
ncbi:MAG: DUF452 family protein [Alphaproteobacteria bacterium]|nr:DUF452 family protein [Alphaproteobacteria bacterium]